MEGWIKMHRKTLEWEWFTTPNMYHLYSYLILAANHKDGKWKGIDVKRGELVTGLTTLSRKVGISVRSVRTCLNRLKSTGEIAIKSTNKYSIITILKYDTYNDLTNNNDTLNDTLPNKRATSKRQASDNKQEYKEEEERKEERNPIGENSIFLDKIIQVYVEEDGDYKVLNRKLERNYAGMILGEYKNNYPGSDEQQTLNDLRKVFNGCINIDDNFMKSRMSLGYIANNYNTLKRYFNGKARSRPVTDEAIERIIRESFKTNP